MPIATVFQMEQVRGLFGASTMDNDLQSLRRRCEVRLQTLRIPIPFDLQAFCQQIAELRNRPIRLIPVDLPMEAYGLWVAQPAADFIFYPSGTSTFHQRHI